MSEFKTPKPTDEAKAKALAVSKKAGALALAAGKGLAKAAENGLRNSVKDEDEEVNAVFKPGIKSTVLDFLGRTFIAAPRDLAMPEDFYWAPEDRAVPRPKDFSFQVMEERIYTDTFRRALYRKVAVVVSIASLASMALLWSASASIHAFVGTDKSVMGAQVSGTDKERKCKAMEKMADKNQLIMARMLAECL